MTSISSVTATCPSSRKASDRKPSCRSVGRFFICPAVVAAVHFPRYANTMKRLLIAIAIGAILGGTAVATVAIKTSRPPAGRTFDLSRTSVVKEVQRLGRLETTSFTIEKVIEAGTTGGKLKTLLFGDRILLIAHGQVIAGFDLTKMREEDIVVDGTSLHMRLPGPEILVAALDGEKTQVYDRKLGLLTKGDKDLEAEARLQAEIAIRAAACDAGIFATATESGKRQLATLFTALGFTEVVIDAAVSACR